MLTTSINVNLIVINSFEDYYIGRNLCITFLCVYGFYNGASVIGGYLVNIFSIRLRNLCIK